MGAAIVDPAGEYYDDYYAVFFLDPDGLKLEGMKRELIRAVNNLRKAAKLTIQDTIAWELQRTPATEKVVEAWRGELLTATLATAVTLVNAVQAGTKGIVKLGEEEVGFGF